jgi:branched-chain amino acid transport system ATP-binding protein
LNGKRIDGADAGRHVRGGLVHIMEGRKVLRHLTVEQNLIVGGHLEASWGALRRRSRVSGRIGAAGGAAPPHGRLPVGRRAADAGDRRAIMSDPKLIMIDEPSLGLAPLIIEEVYGAARVAQAGRHDAADRRAEHAGCAGCGRLRLRDGKRAHRARRRGGGLKANEDVREFYLGLNLEGERKSYREVKHYRRRKRWLG